MTFDGVQLVVLSSIEWSAAWQRHQVFASQWAAAGHDVFFVENTGFRDPGWADAGRVLRRAGRLLARRRSSPAGLPPRLKLINPLMLPPGRALSRRLNAGWFVPMLADQLRAAGLRERPVVIAYMPTATILQIIDELRPSAVVYDCADNFYGLPAAPADLAQTEDALLRRASLVLTTSSTLREDKAAKHPRVVELHHGVSKDFFLPAAAPGPAKRFCYFGTIWRALDYAPVRALAEAGFRVDLIGPRKEPPPPLPANARLLPPVPHRRLPETLAHYDGLLLPYADDAYNRGVLPAKIYECLATGLPVLASPLPALEPLRGLVTVARAPQDWVAAARALPEPPGRREARVAAARERAQEKMFARLRELVRQAWEEGLKRPAPSPPGRHVRALIGGFSWIGLLYGAAKASTLLTQVVAGRLLGPEQFGRANVAIAAAAYLQLAPMLGFPMAISRFVAGAPDDEARRRVASTALAAFGLWGAAALAALAAARPSLPGLLGIPPDLLDLALLLAAATSIYTVVSSPLLGLRRFERRGLAEVVYGLTAPAALAFLVWRRGPSESALIVALCVSLAAGAVYAAAALRGRLASRLERSVAWPLLRYAAVATLNLLATACILAPARLILNVTDSAEAVGVFSAYFTASVQIALALTSMLTAVIVPVTTGDEAQDEAWRAFERSRWKIAGGAGLFFLAASSAAVALFGRRYPFHPAWLLLFASAASLVLTHGVYSALYSARSFRGLGVSVAGSLLAGAVNAGAAWLLIPRLGITGAALALLCGFGCSLAFYVLIGYRRRP